MSASEAHKKFLENVQVDLKHLAHEAKKKHPPFRKSCEEAAARVSEGLSSGNAQLPALSEHVLSALVHGCELKEPKIVKQCLGAIQRLILQRTVSEAGAAQINAAAWSLMRASVEEVKVLQTVTLLLTTSSVARGDTLAKALALCFRLCFCRDTTVMNTAVATVWQIVSLVFERVVAEMAEHPPQESSGQVKPSGAAAPASLKAAAADAYLLFQDLVLLVNGEQPCWLSGLTEMTRTFGLDLMESLLASFPSVFLQLWEFTFLLKERVCAMAIRLFSPNVKCRGTAPSSPTSAGGLDKPYFPTSLRLMRVISVLIQKYYSVLVMECEIFLSLLVKLLDWERPPWQRALALEVLHQLCVSKPLIVSFCASYDVRPQSTKVFQEIINALDQFVGNLFSQTNSNSGYVDSSLSGPLASPGSSLAVGLTAMPTFSMGDVWIPLSVLFPQGTTKATFMEMTERIEPPAVPEGYCLALAYACLLELVENIYSAVCQPSASSSATVSPSAFMLTARPSEVDGAGEAGSADALKAFDDTLGEQLVSSSCEGLLSLLSLLLQASSDEGATESLLRCLLLLTQTCGAQRHLVSERNRCVAAICRGTLPPHYHLAATQLPLDSPDGAAAASPEAKPVATDANQKQQVVAVGAALPTSSLVATAHQCPVMLTAKNLQCLRTLMSLAVESGSFLDKSWYMVLMTLQHVAWVLGLKCTSFYSSSSSSQPASSSVPPSSCPPTSAAAGLQTSSSSSSVPAASSADVTAAVLTTAVLTDIPALTRQLEAVIVASRQLDDVALHHVIDALSRLSGEVMVLPVSNREPSLFAVCGLLGVGLSNSDRAATYWRPLTAHLLETCRHQHVRLREAAADAVACLVRAALQVDTLDQKLQTLVLTPLLELNCVGHPEVRLRQLQCTLHVLHSCGERLATGWPLLLDIVASIDDKHTDQLVRLAFQCLQLIVTDLLSVMPGGCLRACVSTVALFGSQKHELNIALTAIGFMWNISDYFYQNGERLAESLSADPGALPEFPSVTPMSPFDRLWMCLFSKIGDLCVDSRPAVRKSAGQTLFSTISAHGSLLATSTWSSVLTQVLFPLLERVGTACNTASMDKLDDTHSILIHHTRNTAHKQWAETQVLALSGVARVFQTRHSVLSQLAEFQQFWSVLLEFVQQSALSINSEVSLAALKALQELIDSPDRAGEEELSDCSLHWHTAWKVWLDIGVGVTSCSGQQLQGSEDNHETTAVATETAVLSIPSQIFLTTLVQTFPALFAHIQDKFDSSQFQCLCSMLTACVTVPVLGDSQYTMLSDGSMSPLQDSVLTAIDTVTHYLMSRYGDCDMICLVFSQLFMFVQFGCRPAESPLSSVKLPPNSAAVYVSFAESALSRALSLFERTLSFNAVIEGHILEKFIQCVEMPLARKYSCPALSVWRSAVRALVSVLRQGLPLLRQHRQHAMGVWSRLPACLDAFLFSKSKPPENLSGDDLLQDESLDCAVVQLIRQDILPYHNVVPNRFLVDLMLLLNKGSLHSDDSLSPANGLAPMREQFASACFDTLLVYSLRVPGSTAAGGLGPPAAPAEDISSQLAVTALVHRFHEVLTRFLADSVSSGQCPLPRHRMTEMCFVLRAIKSVLISIRSSDSECVNDVTWQQLVRLYSPLVQCTLLSSELIAQPLCECLLEFGSFLHPTTKNPVSSETSNGK